MIHSFRSRLFPTGMQTRVESYRYLSPRRPAAGLIHSPSTSIGIISTSRQIQVSLISVERSPLHSFTILVKMTSHPPRRCCIVGVAHTGTPQGTIESIAGVRSYVVRPSSGSASHAVVLMTDALGMDFINTQLYVLTHPTPPLLQHQSLTIKH